MVQVEAEGTGVWFKDFIFWSESSRVAVEGLREVSSIMYLL